MRILCLLIPHFPLKCEALRDPDIEGRPAVVTYHAGSQKFVLDHSSALEGLQLGMSLQEALARYGELHIVHADVPYYWSIFNELLDSLERVSPLVEDADLGSAYIGLDGLQLIYPTDNDLIKAIREAIPETLAAQIGIAQAKFLAYLMACYCPPGSYRVFDSNLDDFLRDLPCDVLPVSVRSKEKLRDFGIRTLGQIAALPPGPLQAQFGPEGKRIWELARGYDKIPLHPRYLDEVIEENTTLASVTVSLEAITATVESLLSRAFARVCMRGRGISRLTVWTRTWDAGRWERKIQFKEPAMDVKSAMSRIKHFLESYPQPGPVEQVGIHITRLGYGIARQKSIFSEVRANDHLLADIKRLELRLDSPQVFKVKEIEPWSRIPERRFGLAPLSQ